MSKMSWEEAVLWLKNQSGQQELVKACYFDDDLISAIERFSQSEEWLAIREVITAPVGKALDLGAGRGLSSYALSKEGWEVTALEPDPSELVGTGAIRTIVRETGFQIEILETRGEKLPFDDEAFDLVYGRQVLHHANNLDKFCQEASRVLKSGGVFIVTREHVISKKNDLQVFLDNHPLHFLYGGENAFLLEEYLSALSNSGLEILNMLGQYETPINYFPMSYEQLCMILYFPFSKVLGSKVIVTFSKLPFIGEALTRTLAKRKSKKDNTPGRLYTFVCTKKGKLN